jgi:hypothetical protein
MSFPPGTGPVSDPSRPPDFRAETIERIAGALDWGQLMGGAKAVASFLGEVLSLLIQWLATIVGWIAVQFIRGIAKGMDAVDPAFGEIAKAGISALFGINVPSTAFTKLTDVGSREELKKIVGRVMMQAVTGSAPDAMPAAVQPSLEPTERYLGTIANFAIEGWLMEAMTELESLGFLKEFGTLKDTIAEMFGFGRLTRRILGPLIDVSITTPARWHINKTFTPELLAPSTIVRQLARGLMSDEEARNELALQGFNDKRINALISENRKQLSVGDVLQMVQSGKWGREEALGALGELGYDDETRSLVLIVDGERRIAQHHAALVSALTTAYVNRDLDNPEFVQTLDAFGLPEPERNLAHELAQVRRAVSVKHLSPQEAEQCVRARVLSMVDYREALRRAGYTPPAMDAKELLLRYELDTKTSIEKHRAALEADRAAEQAKRDAAAAAKLAAVDKARAEAQRGDEGDLEDAAIRGLIPFARVEEVYRFHYDADTVAVLLARLESRRQDYLAAQQRAADAAQRAAARGLSVADLEAAVLANVLTLDRYRAGLIARGISGDDAAILIATLTAKKRDQDAARAVRDKAAAAAGKRGIDLGRFEQLVRRGVRTIAEYTALLRSLDFNDAAIADMSELLRLQIGEDADTRAARADAEATTNARGLSVDEFRRAVILGLKTDDEFAEFLMQQHFTADKQELLLTELTEAVANAEAARARRELADARGGSRAIPLSTLARAARLGLVSPTRYQARLVEEGYDDADALVEMDLLTQEIADVQTARALRNQVEPAAKARRLSLAELAAAVKRGLKTLEDYRARAVDLGLDRDAADTVTRILADEVKELNAARERRDQAAGALSARGISLGDFEAAVRNGLRTLDDYGAQLEAWGFSTDDAALLMGLLGDEL